MTVKLGNDLVISPTYPFSTVYTAEANYFIAAGVLSLLMSGYSIFMNFNPNISPLFTSSAYLNTVMALCFQFSMAIYSSITSNVMSQESGNFSLFQNSRNSGVI